MSLPNLNTQFTEYPLIKNEDGLYLGKKKIRAVKIPQHMEIYYKDVLIGFVDHEIYQRKTYELQQSLLQEFMHGTDTNIN